MDGKAHSDAAAGRFDRELTELLYKKVLAEHEAFRISDLDIDGADLIEMGFESGPQVGFVLECLLTSVIENEVKNNHAALMDAAGDYLDTAVVEAAEED